MVYWSFLPQKGSKHAPTILGHHQNRTGSPETPLQEPYYQCFRPLRPQVPRQCVEPPEQLRQLRTAGGQVIGCDLPVSHGEMCIVACPDGYASASPRCRDGRWDDVDCIPLPTRAARTCVANASDPRSCHGSSEYLVHRASSDRPAVSFINVTGRGRACAPSYYQVSTHSSTR